MAYTLPCLPQSIPPEDVALPSDMASCHVQGHYWVLDPIDGTRGFVGMRQYAVCLGMIDHGQVRAMFPASCDSDGVVTVSPSLCAMSVLMSCLDAASMATAVHPLVLPLFNQACCT